MLKLGGWNRSATSDSFVLYIEVDFVKLLLFVFLHQLGREDGADGVARVLGPEKLLLFPADGVDSHVTHAGASFEDVLETSGLSVHHNVDVLASWLVDVEKVLLLISSLSL